MSISKFPISYILYSIFFLIFLFSIFYFLFSGDANAATLLFISDTVSTSEPISEADHEVRFTLTNPIPVSGRIVINFDNNTFFIPAGFDYFSVDFLVNGVNKNLASAPGSGSGSAIGVMVFGGYAGMIIFTLNDTDNIPSGSDILIKIGLNATFGQQGIQQLVNPAAIGSHKIYIQTKNASEGLLNDGKAMAAIVAPVLMWVFDHDPPVRFNGLPSGALPGGTVQVALTLNTDEIANCRYAATSGVDYNLMPYSLAYVITGNKKFHLANVSVAGQTSYSFYVRCIDRPGNINPDDYIISFSVGAVLPPPGPVADVGGGGIGPGAVYPALPPAPVLTIEGWAYPYSRAVLLQDGKKIQETRTVLGGKFAFPILELKQGTYTFSVWAEDPDGRKSPTYSTTLTVVSGTKTSISKIFLGPTIELATTTIMLGKKLEALGYSTPDSVIEILIQPREAQVSAEDIIKKIKSDRDGKWNLSFNVSSLQAGTYSIKARSFLSEKEISDFSNILYFGVGKAPTISLDFCGRADINKDKKVNLVDFSILLYHWETDNVSADINADGKVNLTDFSIMMYCWTG